VVVRRDLLLVASVCQSCQMPAARARETGRGKRARHSKKSNSLKPVREPHGLSPDPFLRRVAMSRPTPLWREAHARSGIPSGSVRAGQDQAVFRPSEGNRRRPTMTVHNRGSPAQSTCRSRRAGPGKWPINATPSSTGEAQLRSPGSPDRPQRTSTARRCASADGESWRFAPRPCNAVTRTLGRRPPTPAVA
jgi:hypothetical protein